MATTTTTTPTFTVKGKSGTNYTFYYYKWPTSFKKDEAMYFFVKMNNTSVEKYLYVGETEDLGERFDAHHKMDCITKNGVTHIGAYVQAGKEKRLEVERDILAVIRTTCNG